uniref:Uncharacterized protein n=1 Tax=Megaselia scalaris TaxID=36166 RepID=T1GMX4_MEGSC
MCSIPLEEAKRPETWLVLTYINFLARMFEGINRCKIYFIKGYYFISKGPYLKTADFKSFEKMV